MYNPFKPLFDAFIAWLQQQFDAILNSLNPMNWIVGAAQFISDQLPAADTRIASIASQMQSAVSTLAVYVSLFDYIINLPAFFLAVLVVVTIELAIGAFRAWRIVRSVIT